VGPYGGGPPPCGAEEDEEELEEEAEQHGHLDLPNAVLPWQGRVVENYQHRR